MRRPLLAPRDATRVLVRLAVAWTVAGVLLAAFWEVLLDRLWLYALGFWGAYAFAGAVLGVLAVRYRHAAPSRAAGLALVAVVPVVLAALWWTAGVLRAGGNAVAAWAGAP